MLRLLTLPLLLRLAGAAPPSPGDTIPLVLQRLALTLTVDYDRGAVQGNALLVLRNRSRRPVATIPLLLNRLMVVAGVSDRANRPVRFTQRVSIFDDDSTLQVNAISVTLARPLPPGDSLAVTLRYGGVLVGYAETGSLYIRDHVSREFTILREDAFAFPVLGLPSWQSNRTIVREPFDFRASITVPESLVVATGGEFVGREQRDSLVSWTYRSNGSVPFLNITIAPYQVRDGPASRIFYFPADSAGASMLQGAVEAALQRFEQWYGSLPGRPLLIVMEIPEGLGSQASLTAGIIQTADAFRARSELRQVYHELSHLWNVPDLEVPSPRWNEGLATFLQWRMAGELDGWDDWNAQVDRVAASLVERCAPPAACGTVPLASYGRVGATDRSYGVGMLMFYALYRTIGAESFDRAYRTFYQKYGQTGAATDALVASFRSVDPRSDLVFDEWLGTSGWYGRLAGGEKVSEMLARYRTIRRP